ncbi:proprotein convertase P-domain-containing protein [Dactylosporangium sp. NPDC000244]|uniref:proprotein convertase P-domain-containing protein n=1 Tax=Dactylosporangium sp. NPDC000244 TaxID=3154365 RepID=UPI003324C831
MGMTKAKTWLAAFMLAASAGVVLATGGTAAAATPCVGVNNTDTTIPDLGSVESPIAIAGCAGSTAPANATVEVHIVHPYRGDLVVTLVAPDGSTYVLANRSGGSADNLDQTFTVNLSSEAPNGTWKLRVQDAAATDTGFINTWNINVGPTAALCPGTNNTALKIPDPGTVDSPITIAGCAAPTASPTSTVEVHIVHTYRGDLVVTLVAPDGTPYILSNRSGGSADNIDQTYTMNLSGKAPNGTWKLRVQDAAAADTGYISTWSIKV